MATTLAATFTLIGCIRGSLYGDIWNLVRLVHVGETLNCELEVTSRGRFKEIWHYSWPYTTCHLMQMHCTLFFNKAW